MAHAATEEWLSGPLFIKVQALGPGTRNTYVSSVKNMLQEQPAQGELQGAIQDKLCQIAQQKRGGSAARGILSAIRFLEKLQLLPSTITEERWLYAKAIERQTKVNAPNRMWATTEDLENLGKVINHWAWE